MLNIIKFIGMVVAIILIAALWGLVVVVAEAVLASDYTCKLYGGRRFIEAINPIEWVYRLYAHHPWWYFVLSIITGVIIWGFVLFVPLYALIRVYREDYGKLTEDADYISIKFHPAE